MKSYALLIFRSQIGVEKEAEVYGLPEIVIIDGKITVADCQIRQTVKSGKCLKYNKDSVDDNCNNSVEDYKIVPVKRVDIPGFETESKVNSYFNSMFIKFRRNYMKNSKY